MQVMHCAATRRVLRSRVLWNVRTAALAAVLSIFSLTLLCGSRPAVATESVPLSFDQTIHDAGPIVVGKVTAAQTHWGDSSQRWMYTSYTVHIDDSVSNSPDAAVGSDMVISFWGGRIGQHGMAMADTVMPQVGARYLLMLRPDWTTAGFTPTVGFEQGLFLVQKDHRGRDMVLVSDGRVLAADAAGRIAHADELKGRAVNPAAGVTLADVTRYIRANLAHIRAESFAPAAKADPNDRRIMKTFSLTPEAPGATPSAPTGTAQPATLPSSSKQVPQIPLGPGERTERASATVASADSFSPDFPPSGVKPAGAIDPSYFTHGYCSLPITINDFPSSFTPWSPEDQYQMSKWNYYGGWINVYASPTGTFAWGNKRFDLDGWPSNSDMQSQYGYTWGSTTLAITFWDFDSGSHVDEADIAFNPAFSWTLDDAWIFSGASPAWPFRATMLHELGHLWGLDHNFNFVSIMNYCQQVYRAWAVPFMDDANAIRAVYPSNAVGRNDLGVYLFYDNGYQSYAEASYPGWVVAGDPITVSNFHVENVGTTTISSPTMQWYLTTSLNYSDPYYYLGTTSYSPALPPFNYYNPASISATETVPSGTPGGAYYINAYVPSDDGYIDFPFSNNYAWSYYKLTVYPLLDALYAPSEIPMGSGDFGTAYLAGDADGNGLYVYLSSDNSDLSVPSYTYVQPYSYYSDFEIDTNNIVAPETATITAYSNGKYQYAPVTITVPTAIGLNSPSAQYGVTLSAAATLTRTTDSAKLAGQYVYFYVDGTYNSYAVTAANGVATASILSMPVGSHSLAAAFYDSNGYQTSYGYSTITITKAPTSVTGQANSGAYGKTIGLKATLKRTTGNHLMTGAAVTFAIGGTTLGTVNTVNGLAKLMYQISDTLPVGVNTVTAGFAGNSNTLASSGNLTLTVSAANTSVVVPAASGKRGTNVVLRATLRRSTDNGPLPGKMVKFSVDGSTVGTVSTDASGKASKGYIIPPGSSAGTHHIRCDFSGGAKYLASFGTGILTEK